jgi:hypothetical protein
MMLKVQERLIVRNISLPLILKPRAIKTGDPLSLQLNPCDLLIIPDQGAVIGIPHPFVLQRLHHRHDFVG